MSLVMNNYYLFTAVSVISAIVVFNVYPTNTDKYEDASVLETIALKDNLNHEKEPAVVSDTPLQENAPLEALVKKSESHLYSSKKMQRSGNIENFSEVVHKVREQISLGIAPTKEDFIATMREVYSDRPASFKRNLERDFKEALNPAPYCNEMRESWAQPYISEINAGYVFVNEALWQKNSPSSKVQLSQYISKCTQDSQPFELIAQSGGYTIAYYSLNKGYKSASL
jgi:hypothetical protein